MPARTLLSSEQRTRLFAIPTESVEMVRHYTLGADDLALIRTKRRSINRLGFAVQLCLLRYPRLGMRPAEQPPEAMIGFVAHQLGLSSADFADYAQRDQTRREYAVELQRYLGLRRRARPVCLSLRRTPVNPTAGRGSPRNITGIWQSANGERDTEGKYENLEGSDGLARDPEWKPARYMEQPRRLGERKCPSQQQPIRYSTQHVFNR
jgi:hypothetical protein